MASRVSSRSLQQRVQTRVLLEPPTNGSSRPTVSRQPSIANVDPGITDVAYWDLLSHPDIDESISRAKSASDAAVLRRKGHLKEQDNLIEFMRSMHNTHTCEEVMYKMERWVQVSIIAFTSCSCNSHSNGQARQRAAD